MGYISEGYFINAPKGAKTDCPRSSCKLKDREKACSSPDCALREHFAPVIDTDFYYFKPSGKWKYEGKGCWPDFGVDGWCHEDIARANGGKMPGIIGDGFEFVVVCIPRESCEHRTAFPRIIRAKDTEE